MEGIEGNYKQNMTENKRPIFDYFSPMKVKHEFQLHQYYILNIIAKVLGSYECFI